MVGGNAGRSSARHGDSVDAVDSGGEVDSGVVLVSSENAGDEREEEDEDGLEGAHGG